MRLSCKRGSLSNLPFDFLLFLALASPLNAVEVTIAYEQPLPPGLMMMTCSNLAPGVCYSVPTVHHRNPTTSTLETKTATLLFADFQYLLTGDNAAVWKDRDTITEDAPTTAQTRLNGCSTQILHTGHRPGIWIYTNMPGIPASAFGMTAAYGDPGMGGASYIRVPTIAYPPTGMMANILTMEGVLGLAWRGGQWFASDAAAGVVGRAKGGLTTFPRKRKRGIRSELKGTVYAQGPSRWVYPDKVEVNGTEYVGGQGSLVYKSIDGRMLNLTSANESGG